MMDVRERLVELIHNARMNALWHNAQKPDEYITDMLMEDGVTVHEWTVQQIIERLAWWARNCGDQCPAAEAMEQAIKKLNRCIDCERLCNEKMKTDSF